MRVVAGDGGGRFTGGSRAGASGTRSISDPDLLLRDADLAGELLQYVHRHPLFFGAVVLDTPGHLSDLLVGRVEARIHEPLVDGVLSGMLAEHQLALGTDHVRGHHARLEGVAVLDDAGGVDAALVGEGVLADDGFVGRDRDAGFLLDDGRDLGDAGRVDAGVGAVDRFRGHDDFLVGSIPGPLADPVDRDLCLVGPGLDSGDGVCRRHAEVVVGMDVDTGVGVFAHEPDQIREPRRAGDAGRIRDVHPVDVGPVDGLEDRRQVLPVGAGRVHRREHHLCPAFFGLFDGPDRALLDLLAVGVHRVLDLDVAGAREDMDHVHFGFDGGRNVGFDHAGQASDGRLRRPGDVPNGFEFGVAVCWEPRLDDVGTHFV